MSKQTSSRPVLQITQHLLLSAFGFGLAWLLWSFTTPEWWMFGFYAGLCLLGGVIRLVRALMAILELLFKRREVAKFEAKGSSPKADKIARISDLKKRGLIK